MKILTDKLPILNSHDQHQVYNGLDCCLTFEIFDVLSEQLRVKNEPYNAQTYAFERGMQAPALEMMERGWRVDEIGRKEGQQLLSSKKERLENILNRFAWAAWGKGLNARSPKQLKEFFYEVMRLPEQYKNDKGKRSLSTNREALEKLHAYFNARPIINTIMGIRDVTKKLGVLNTDISSDGRMRTSYNVAGTETGRWSSSSSADGSGTNLQNITSELRRMFVADEGWKLCYMDLEQAESRIVGLLVHKYIGDARYLDACESGDLHTTVCKMVWPKLAWPGTPKGDREIADQMFYRQFTYRDMAKRGGHGTNYFGRPQTMAMHLKVETSVMVDFQKAYFTPFIGISKWHEYVRQEILGHRKLVTLLGRERAFYGRPNDDSTLREAIAFEPQSVVGDLLNTALWRVWRYEPRVQILGQIHDAIVFQYPDNPATEVDIINNCLNLTRIPITASGRTITIPSEAKFGWNWGDADGKRYKDGNPNGLVKFRGEPDQRRRLD